MKLYHYSITYQGDASLKKDYHRKYLRVEPMLLSDGENRVLREVEYT